MSGEYWIVKLKPGPRWLDNDWNWTPNRKDAVQLGRGRAYQCAGGCDEGDIPNVVVVHVKRKPKAPTVTKLIPMPSVEAKGITGSVNGMFITHMRHESKSQAPEVQAQTIADNLRKALESSSIAGTVTVTR